MSARMVCSSHWRSDTRKLSTMIDTPIMAATAMPSAATATPVRLREAATSSRARRPTELKPASPREASLASARSTEGVSAATLARSRKSAAKPARTLRREPAMSAHAISASTRLSQESRLATRATALEHGAPESELRGTARDLERRQEACDERGAEAGAQRLGDGCGRQCDLLDRYDVVKIIHRLRHQADEPVADGEPQQYAESGARRSERGRFAEDDGEDVPTGRPQRAQDRDDAS